MDKEVFNELGIHRAPLGRKPTHISSERVDEAKRLTSIFSGKRGISFVRLGDFDVVYLLAAENSNSANLFSSDSVVSGTQGMGSPGLDVAQASRLRVALERADYLDYHECLWKDGTILDRLALHRASGTTHNPNRNTSYILPTWLEHEFKAYCQKRRVLFCGAEAPLLKELLKYPEFQQITGDFWPQQCEFFFLRPRENGRNLAANLDGIKQDLAEAVAQGKIDTLFLSLGGGAKILCYELARENDICAIDFGALLRSLTYSGSDGNRASRATHTVFLFRVPFSLYMDALEKTFPDLRPEELLAKAHAQLLLEVQEKELGWSHSAGEYDFSPSNVAYFREGFRDYKHRYRDIFGHSAVTRKERADFLHFCGIHKLTMEGRFFLAKFRAKSAIARRIRKSQ